MSSAQDEASWHDPPAAGARAALLDPSTQIVADRDAYLGQGRNDVGRRISNDQVELFVSSAVAEALQHEFALHTPEFIAIHDVGAGASLRLLVSLASASATRMQRLSIRRQGHGVALAVLQFVELRLDGGAPLRVYATDIEADAETRARAARVLLAYSRLGVLLVGELAPNLLATRLAPLHEAIERGPWPNRELLMVPLGSGVALAAPATQLGGRSALAVHVTPHAERPRQAWSYISGAWNRLNGSAGSGRALSVDAVRRATPAPPAPRAGEAPTERMPLRPPPAAAAGAPDWAAYAQRCMQIKGAVSCCVFDTLTMHALAHAGGAPSAEAMALQGAVLLGSMDAASRALGLGSGQAEASISVASHHLLLRHVPGHPRIAVHLALQASAGHLTLARMQLDRVASPAH